MFTNTCKQCGQPFQARNSRARYCGPVCFKASQADNHIKGLIDQLERASYAPHEDPEKWRRYWRRVFAEPGTLNINSLDPECPHGDEDPFDRDKLKARAAGESLEVDTSHRSGTRDPRV